MKKTYVLDTNVLLQAPYALECFEDNDIVLPVAVLEELDHLKTEDGDAGANARAAIRYLENLRQAGNMTEGIRLRSGGVFRLEINHVNEKLPEGFIEGKNDNRILKVCKGISNDGMKVILVTKDIMVRIKAQLMNIEAEDFTTEQAPVPAEQYTGRAEVYAEDSAFDDFKKKGIHSDRLYITDTEGNRQPARLEKNEFLIIHSDIKDKKTHLGIFDGEKAVPLTYKKALPFGIHPRNVGQFFMQEALMKNADQAPLVIIKGMAGTAKTFYSLAVGLEKMLGEESGIYRKIMISRPNAQFDDNIGFLPGDEQEKISPLMRPIIDNLELLVDQDDKKRFSDEDELNDKIQELFDREYILPQAMNFIRGRSITRTYLIIDEAQNLTPKQAKGIITRAGSGTKIILIGDPYQIDNPLLDERSNGLSFASEKMKGSPLCYQLTLSADECERSDLAMDAVKRWK